MTTHHAPARRRPPCLCLRCLRLDCSHGIGNLTRLAAIKAAAVNRHHPCMCLDCKRENCHGIGQPLVIAPIKIDLAESPFDDLDKELPFVVVKR